MAAKRATARTIEAVQPEPSLPGVLIPPSMTPEHQRAAYELELIDNPEEFRKAISTEEFFPMVKSFPEAWWKGRLSMTLYRMEDEDGVMLKNADGKKKKMLTFHVPVDDEYVAKRWGGGKYRFYLQLDHKDTLRQETFEMDKSVWGPPKVMPGQTVEIDGKAVTVTGTVIPPAAQADPRSDVATIIDANSRAEEKRSEMLLEAHKASIELVKENAITAAKPDAQSGLMDKFLTVMIERMMNPPAPPPTPDPIDTFVKLQGLIQKQNPETPDPKDPPITEAMDLVEKFTGKSFSELMRGKSAPAAEATPPWLAIALGVAEKFFAVAPTLFQQATYAKSLEFQRAVWLRSAQPGAQPPKELLAENAAQPQPRAQQQPTQSAAQQAPTELNAAQLAEQIVLMVCHGFDSNPYDGEETAAAIAFNFGKQIEATGLDQLLADEAQVNAMVQGNPLLKQRSAHARWTHFQEEFMDYMAGRFGAQEPNEPPKPGPQPVA